ncbi:uncharacterized protein TrAtP1_001458 [Trichoderma atroviride]|uniref:uncharacterized protein n=1 Tax=Hypocrea atroviridis TaxID=63577 RepID=UPI003318A2CA|nr:hypothetical protein TrAtP1_001458 [Trichoderma atroviride]
MLVLAIPASAHWSMILGVACPTLYPDPIRFYPPITRLLFFRVSNMVRWHLLFETTPSSYMTPTAVSAALLALAESALHIAARWHLFALDTSRMPSGAQHVASGPTICALLGFGVESGKVSCIQR